MNILRDSIVSKYKLTHNKRELSYFKLHKEVE
jgi:hypothetical protein